MFSKVVVKKGALNHFRKLARHSPLEVHAYLVGEVKTPDLVEISSFIYPKSYHIQTPTQVQWTVEEYIKVQKEAEDNNKRVIGFIHSHPEWDAVMSPADYEACLIEGHILCGIVSVYNKKTRVRFWTPTSSLPCEIRYKE